MDILLRKHLGHTRAGEREVPVRKALERDRKRAVDHHDRCDEIGPVGERAIEGGSRVVAVRRAGVFDFEGVEPEALEHRIEQAGVAPFVLRHGRGGDSGLDRGGAQQPVAVADAEEPLGVGQAQNVAGEGLGSHDPASPSGRFRAHGPSGRLTGMTASRGTTHISNQFSSS